MARLGSSKRSMHCLRVAHFADQDHVGIASQSTVDRVRKASDVPADLSMTDDRSLWFVPVFDRILNRDDMLCLRGVDPVDDRRKRGRFTASRWTGEKNQACRSACERGNNWG